MIIVVCGDLHCSCHPNLNRVLQLNLNSTQYRFFFKFINHCLDFHQQFKIGGYFTFSLSIKFCNFHCDDMKALP